MYCKCPECNTEWGLYEVTAIPCPNCGNKKLMFLHLCSNFKENHWVLINIESNIKLSYDPCDDIKMELENGI